MVRYILGIFLVSLFLVASVGAQTLTNTEKTLGEGILIYYSGNLPNIPSDKTKTDAYIYGDETAKRVAIKTFVKDILLPAKQTELTQLQAVVAVKEAELTELQGYVK